MQQNPRNSWEKEKLTEIYHKVSLSQSSHNRILTNLTKMEATKMAMEDGKEKITYIEELRRPQHSMRKVVACFIVITVVALGVLLFTSGEMNNQQRASSVIPSITLAPEDTNDAIDDYLGENIVSDVDTKKNKVEALITQFQDNELLMEKMITKPDGYVKAESNIKEEAKCCLCYWNKEDKYESYFLMDQVTNDYGTSLIMKVYFSDTTSNTNDIYLYIASVNQNNEKNMETICIPLNHMSYSIEYENEELVYLQLLDTENTVKGTFTLTNEGWIMDDTAQIVMKAAAVSNAYLRGDLERVKENVETDDVCVCDQNILDTMKPYIIKWDPAYVSREESFSVQCQFYGPYDDDSYSYLSLSMEYVDNKLVVTSMGVEK